MRGRWPWIAGLGTFLAMAWAGYRAIDAWQYREGMRTAQAKIAARSPAPARRALAEVVGRWPGRGEAEYLLGACELALGHSDAADAAWASVPPGSPFWPHAALMRARSALKGHRFAVAEQFLPTALGAKGPNATEARETLVNLYKIQGRFDEARALVLQAWGIYPDKVGLLKELEKLGSNNPLGLGVARTALEQASRNAPDDDRVWLGWANLATRSGDFDEAKRWLDACLRHRPDDAAVWRGRLGWAFGIQDEDEVERALRHLPADRFSPPEVLFFRAWFAARSGDAERERRVQEEIVAREPGDLRALGRLADLALAAGQPDRAARLRDRRAELNGIRYQYESSVLGLGPDNAPEVARWAETLGRYFEAHSVWSVVARADPKNREAREAMTRLEALNANRPAGPTLRDLLADLDAAPKSAREARPLLVGAAPDFVDDAVAVGLRFAFDNGATPIRHIPETTAGGVGLIDFDGDGWLDVYLTQAGPFPPDLASPETSGDRLFRNKGDGTFEDATESSGLAAFARGYGHGVTVGDVDNDGRPDLFVTRWRRYALYRNRGDGTFEDVTERYGLGGERDWPTSAAFADLDGDGDLDLYVGHYLSWDAEHPSPCWDEKRQRNSYCAPQHFEALPDHLFRNDGGRFVDVSEEAGIVDRDGRALGVLASDLDGDGKIDLFVANDQTANFLFRNTGGLRFEEVGATSGVASSGDGTYQASMGIACGDTDGDGRPDLAVTNFFNEYTTLYQNRGGGIFTDGTAAAGLSVPTRSRLGFGVAFLDANNDGLLDLATANGHVDDFRPEIPYQMPAQLLLGVPGGKFVDATATAGPPWQVPRVARGLAAGDLDNDGRPDLLIASHDQPLAFFHNRTAGGHWLSLRLEGTKSHRDAVGARIAVTAGGRRHHAWRVGGGSFQSASDARLHFGLGGEDRAERVEVTWPSGHVDRYGPLTADTGYLLRERASTPEPLAGFQSPQTGPVGTAHRTGPGGEGR